MTTGTVLISGCSSGIGRETAIAFLEDGWEVYATDPEPDDLAGLAERGCETLELDVTDTASVNEAVDHALDEQGHIDCLINNAGYGQLGPLEDVPVDRLKRQFEVNTFGAHRLTRAVLPSMREHGSGTIINNSSIYGRVPMIGQGAYCASKYALEGISDTLRAELSEYDIDVVLIEPGPVDTRFGDRAPGEEGDRAFRRVRVVRRDVRRSDVHRSGAGGDHSRPGRQDDASGRQQQRTPHAVSRRSARTAGRVRGHGPRPLPGPGVRRVQTLPVAAVSPADRSRSAVEDDTGMCRETDQFGAR